MIVFLALHPVALSMSDYVPTAVGKRKPEEDEIAYVTDPPTKKARALGNE